MDIHFNLVTNYYFWNNNNMMEKGGWMIKIGSIKDSRKLSSRNTKLWQIIKTLN